MMVIEVTCVTPPRLGINNLEERNESSTLPSPSFSIMTNETELSMLDENTGAFLTSYDNENEPAVPPRLYSSNYLKQKEISNKRDSIEPLSPYMKSSQASKNLTSDPVESKGNLLTSISFDTNHTYEYLSSMNQSNFVGDFYFYHGNESFYTDFDSLNSSFYGKSDEMNDGLINKDNSNIHSGNIKKHLRVTTKSSNKIAESKNEEKKNDKISFFDLLINVKNNMYNNIMTNHNDDSEVDFSSILESNAYTGSTGAYKQNDNK